MIEYLNMIMWLALIAAAFLFLISGLDDIILDLCYWTRHIYRKLKSKTYKPLTYQTLAALPEKKIALIIPCWMEFLVIGDMLNYNLENIDYGNYDVFVGAYPNDGGTIEAVEKLQWKYNNLFLVCTERPGPSSKADNLNNVYFYMLERQAKFNIKYEIIIMHDVEDIIHPLSFKLYNYLIPQKDMVQTPIFPLPISYTNWTYWTYADEFAEVHTKELIIREALFGFVPSAGVGTALGTRAIELLANKNNGRPFNEQSLVEDYDMAYQLNLLNADQIFLVQFTNRVKNVKSWWSNKLKPKMVKEYVATFALFPKNYAAAIKQKGRWCHGIALQQWQHRGWEGPFLIKLLLYHDRKSLFSNLINGFGYLVLFYWIFIYFYNKFVDPDTTTLNYYFDVAPWVWTLFIFCILFMAERLFQRACATYRVYGFIPALLSVPRTLYSNIINLNAIYRAYRAFFKRNPVSRTTKAPAKWEKTTNRFPSQDELIHFKTKLGDVLLQDTTIKYNNLRQALAEQAKTNEPLGTILERNNHVSSTQVIEALARQYHLPIVTVSDNQILNNDKLPFLSSEDYEWMLQHKLFPIDFDGRVLTVAISNPSNNDLKNELIYDKVPAHKIVFALNRS